MHDHGDAPHILPVAIAVITVIGLLLMPMLTGLDTIVK